MDSPLDLATLVERLDYFRGAPRRRQPSGAHKEWQHFIVHAPDIHALINFNIIDHAWSERATPRAHVIVLVRALDRAGWDGDVERFHDGAYAVAEGRVDARFGANTLRFCDGRYHLQVRARDRAIRADIELRPVSIPVLSNNQRLAGGRRISWVFVPRLVASGVIWLDGQRYAIESAPAYHDHNWGEFRWGEDLAWEWASGLPWDPRCPWSVVLWRLSDRGRAVVRSQGLFLFRHHQHHRAFLDEELTVRASGLLRVTSPFKVPRVMAVLSPGAADVPAEIEITARDGGDRLSARFEPSGFAQIITPRETANEGCTTLNEVTGRVTLCGRVRGEDVEMEGPGVFEFVRN